MRFIRVLLLAVLLIAVPVDAEEFTAPVAPREAQRYLPDDTQSLGEGILYVINAALAELMPSFKEALRLCTALIATSLLTSLLSGICGKDQPALSLGSTAAVVLILSQPANTMLQLGVSTVRKLTEYGKLLLPVMTGALAAQGAVTKSGALYTASALFHSLLSSAVAQLLVPLAYLLLTVSVAVRFYDHMMLQNMKDFLKWLLSWGLKTVLYIFTGYISLTGIVSGTTDAAMLKATKLTIAGAVPVVGSILSDASEAVLVSVGLMKNAAGIYGILTMIALCIGPFLQVGVQYLLLNITSGICFMFGVKESASLIKDYSAVMGIILAMLATVCVILLISTVCFMKGPA